MSLITQVEPDADNPTEAGENLMRSQSRSPVCLDYLRGKLNESASVDHSAS